MKDYYKILGIEEEASEEEIRARWVELTKCYHPDLGRAEDGDEKIKEINEAYQVLKDESTRFGYDFERDLKKSVIKAHRHKEKRFNIRKIVVPAGILVLFVVVGIVVLKGFRVAELPKSGVPYGTEKVFNDKAASSIPPGKEESKVIGAKEVRKEIKTAMPQETAKPISIPPSPSPSIDEESNRNEEPARDILAKPEEPVNIGKEIPSGLGLSILFPAEKETKRKEEPVPQGVIKSESPVRVDKEVPKEVPKVASQEGAPSLPQEIAKMDKPRPIDTERQPAQKREAPAKAAQVVFLPPSLLAKEEEVRQFFSSYIDRYHRKDIDGFLSFFSSKAVQNQKDGFMRIKSIYTKFFDESRELRYQVEGIKMEIYQNSVEVKARFRVDQILKMRGERKTWKGDIRWVLVREDGTIKISSLDYQNEKSP